MWRHAPPRPRRGTPDTHVVPCGLPRQHCALVTAIAAVSHLPQLEACPFFVGRSARSLRLEVPGGSEGLDRAPVVVVAVIQGV